MYKSYFLFSCKIVVEKEFKPCVQSRKRIRLNPNMCEVVKKEVIKLLDARRIYRISESEWVIPVQVVPKKGGITVIKNENNKLVPTTIVTGHLMCMDDRKLNIKNIISLFPLLIKCLRDQQNTLIIVFLINSQVSFMFYFYLRINIK